MSEPAATTRKRSVKVVYNLAPLFLLGALAAGGVLVAVEAGLVWALVYAIVMLVVLAMWAAG